MTHYESAIQYENAGEYGKALEIFQRCLTGGGHDKGDLAFHLGWCLEHDPEGDRASVLQYYDQAFASAPSLVMRVNSAFRSGWVLLQGKEEEKAAAAFQRVIALAEQENFDHDLYHQALFWSAVCLERQGRYLEAAHQYGVVQRLSADLVPESCYRLIVCCNQVGKFESALEACRAFPLDVPSGSDPRRFSELSALVRKEESLLLQCLSEDQPSIGSIR